MSKEIFLRASASAELFRAPEELSLTLIALIWRQTRPDEPSSVYQTGPLCFSDSTETVTEPSVVLLHTMSQSYNSTFIFTGRQSTAKLNSSPHIGFLEPGTMELKRLSWPQVMSAYGSEVPFKLAAIKSLAASSFSWTVRKTRAHPSQQATRRTREPSEWLMNNNGDPHSR